MTCFLFAYPPIHTDTLIGTVITQVTGNDVDSGPPLSYTLQLDANSEGMFGIHQYGGGVSLTGSLDYEERTWYTLTVRSSDSKHQSEANLTVLVDDVNDNAPAFTQDLYQVKLPSNMYTSISQLLEMQTNVGNLYMSNVFLTR